MLHHFYFTKVGSLIPFTSHCQKTQNDLLHDITIIARTFVSSKRNTFQLYSPFLPLLHNVLRVIKKVSVILVTAAILAACNIYTLIPLYSAISLYSFILLTGASIGPPLVASLSISSAMLLLTSFFQSAFF